MSRIEAAQMVYAQVEAEQSPRNRPGFQTILATCPPLTENEIEEIEGRLVYHVSDLSPVKRVFFSTSGGKVVVAQIVPLAERDAAGRTGRYLAHCLVLEKEPFLQAGGSPFAIFDTFAFFHSVQEALARGNLAGRYIGPITLDVAGTKQPTVAEQQWPAAELLKVMILGLRTAELRGEGKAIALAGKPDQVYETLRLMFSILPPEKALDCTFDTYFYRCNLRATYFSVVGLPETPDDPRYVVVDIDNRRVSCECSLQPSSPYERWLAANVSTGRVQTCIEHHLAAWQLGQWVEGSLDASSLTPNVPPEVIEQMCHINRWAWAFRLAESLCRQVPPPLVHRIWGRLFATTTSNPHRMWQLSTGGLTPGEVLHLLSQCYADTGFARPSQQEVDALGRLFSRVSDPQLQFVYMCWMGDNMRLARHLESLSGPQYRQLVQFAIRHQLIDPLNLLVSGHAEVFLDVYLQHVVPETIAIPRLVQAIVRVGAASTLRAIADLIFCCKREDLEAVSRIVEGKPKIPDEFIEALKRRLSQIRSETKSAAGNVPSQRSGPMQWIRKRLFTRPE